MAPRETEDNAYAKFWGNKQKPLWYVIVFSGVVNCADVIFSSRRSITWFTQQSSTSSLSSSPS